MIAQNSFYIWNGFSLNWTYNHRINRLGSFVNDTAVINTAATGVGSDFATFETYFTKVKTSHVKPFFYDINFNLNGKEAALIRFEKEYTIALPLTDISKYLKYELLFNGFDIYSGKNADKVQLFEVNIENCNLNIEKKEFKFTLNAKLSASCKSIECQKFENKVDYTCKVQLLLLLGDSTFASQVIETTNDFDWSRKNTFDNTQKIETESADSIYNAIGFRNIRLNLNKAHWMVAWSNTLLPEYNSDSLLIGYSYRYFFEQNTKRALEEEENKKIEKQLKKEMEKAEKKDWKKSKRITKKQEKPFRYKKQIFSIAQNGYGSISSDIVLLSIPNAQISTHFEKGNIVWEGKNKSPNNKNAVYITSPN